MYSNTSRATVQSDADKSTMRLGKLEFDGLFQLLLGIWIRSGSETSLYLIQEPAHPSHAKSIW